MKRLITILLLAISGFASAQTYQLNYPDIRIGNSNTGKIVLRGSNVQFPFLALGSTTDSVLTIVGGVIKKVPRSQFSGGGSSYTFNNGLTNTGGVVGLGGNTAWLSQNGNAQIYFNNNGFYAGRSAPNGEANITVGSTTESNPIISIQTTGFGLEMIQNNEEGYERGITLRDDVLKKGIKYIKDYSKNWTIADSNYLAPKRYVDSVAAASGGGYTLPIASASVLGGIKVGSGLSIDGTGVLSTVGGSAPDTTIYRTVSNSFTKAQTNTQISNAIAAYTPPSQVDNDLSASTTRAPSKSAVNTALALKENSANKQNSLTADGTGVKFPTVDAVNAGLATKGNGTLTSFSKTDGTGIISSVSNPTTTPNHTIAVDTTTIRTVTNSYTLAALQTKFNAYLTTANASATYVPLTRTLTGGVGIGTIGDLSANRTINVDTTVIRTVANSRTLAQTQTALNAKQNTLVSGTNIKTINGSSVLGSGDLVVTASGSYVDLTTNQTVDGLKLFKQDVLIDGSTGSGIKQFGFKDADLNTSFDGGFSFDGGYSYLRSGTDKQMVMASYWGSEIVGNTQGASPYAISAATGTATDHSLRIRQITTTAPIFEVKAASGNSSRILNISSSAGTGDYMFMSSAGALNLPLLTASTLLKLDASKNVVNAVSGTDFVIPSGNVATSTALATSRNLWGVAFNGTANVTGKPVFTAGATGAASINIPHGVAPTSPVNGDFWTTTTGFFARINGVTQSFLPLAGGTLTGGLLGTTSEFSTYSRVGASASTHIDVTSGDVKYYASNGSTLLSVYPLTLTANRVQRYQDKDGTLALLTDIPTTPTLQQVITAGNVATTAPIFRTNLIIENSSASDSRLSMTYDAVSNSMRMSSTYNTTGSYLPITFFTSDLERLRIMPNGNTLFGTTTDNGVDKLQVNGTISATNLVAGTYTPTGTITDGSGTVTSITPLTTHYSRVGNQVTVSGAVTFSTAASNTNVTIELTLPIASNFGNGYDAFGSGDVASSLTNYSAHVIVTGNPTTDKAIITLNTLNGTFTAYYRYMYTII